MNIEGKRSGEGFVTHKALLVKVLSRALSARVTLMDVTIGLKGLLNYFKAIGGSNIVKVVPSSVNASGERVNGHKSLKVVCGNNTSYLEDGLWLGDKTPMTTCDVEVKPKNFVKPNIGNTELAEAINRVLPFTAKEDDRQVLKCVYFVAKEGKLKLVSADGFRLAVVNLDFEDGVWNTLVNSSELRGIASALNKAKRVRVSTNGDNIKTLTIETELICYRWISADGSYPDYEKLIPSEQKILAHFDTLEAIKAIASLKVLADDKEYPIDLTIDDGKILLSNPDDRGQAVIPAYTEGELKIRVNGQYLAEVLKAFGGMVEVKFTNNYSPMLFSQDGFQVVVMPMLTSESSKQAEADKKAKEAEATTEAEAEATTEEIPEAVSNAVAEAVDIAIEAGIIEGDSPDDTKPIKADKPKRKRKAKELVAVA